MDFSEKINDPLPSNVLKRINPLGHKFLTTSFCHFGISQSFQKASDRQPWLTGLDLGIKLTTVAALSQWDYAKLNLPSLNELFALYL
ncbi:MAG: hypothetical protein K9K86_05390 [Pseudomonadales bacterium]|nr:hypothetical protein [Pseudomonadales bacterium]